MEHESAAPHHPVSAPAPQVKRQLPSVPGIVRKGLPVVLLAASLVYLLFLLSGPGLLLGVDLRGGTQIVIDSTAEPDAAAIERVLVGHDATVRVARGLSGWSVLITVPTGIDQQTVMDALSDAGYTFSGFSVQTIGPELGAGFLQQAVIALGAAFVLMAAVIFFIFRTPLPALYVVLAAAADIIETLAFSQLLGIELTLATFAGMLLLLGYSVDTDILLTSRVLKGEGEFRDKVRGAAKTGLTMVGATAVALVGLFIIGASPVITQIASVLLIGLLFDVVNTWLTNASLLEWHVRRKR